MLDELAGTDTVVDALTHQPRLAYLLLRLDEVYAEAAVTGRSVAATHVLVVVETVRAVDPLVQQTRLIALNSALRYAFVGGESFAAAGPRRVVALAGTDEPRLAESLAALRSELRLARRECRLPAVTVRRLPLPDDPAALPALARTLLV